jgi:tetratricopeptide (TPR) repeat protein
MASALNLEEIRTTQEAVLATPEAAVDLDEAIRNVQKYIDAMSEDHPERSTLLHTLGVRLSAKYFKTGEMADLDEALRVIRLAVDGTPRDHPDWLTRSFLLIDTIGDKYSETRVMAYHNEATQLKRDIIKAIPPDHSHLPMLLNWLALGLWTDYSTTGAIADLDEAIEAARQAVHSNIQDSPDPVAYSNTLGVLLSHRFDRIGAIADLDEAIQLLQGMLEAIPEDESGPASYLINLAIFLRNRYSRTRVMADIEESIRLARRAIEAPEDSLDQGKCLHALAAAFRERYLVTEEIDDLEESIHVSRLAVTSVPERHPDMPTLLDAYGSGLRDRYRKTGARADLNESIEFAREALKVGEENDPERAGWSNSLAFGLGERYSITGAISDLQEAISHHKSALNQSSADITTRIDAGVSAFYYYAITRDWLQAYETAEFTIRLIPKLASRSLKNSDKQHMLRRGIPGLASRAAAAALYAEKGPIAAINFLEQGRGVLAASVEELRTDILDLRVKHPKLAEQFTRLQDQLELSATRDAFLTDESLGSSWQARASHCYNAGNDFDKLIIDIRKRPEFKDFLLAPGEAEIRNAARCGPIVIINSSGYRCDALLIEHHQIRSLALPHLKTEDVEEKALRGGLGSPKVLSWLWDAVTSPILNALELTQPPSNDKWPHIWWIPTGLLSKFPLHAAGRHGEGSTETVLDRVMSSYSSSIKAIIHGRRHCVSEDTQTALNHMLLVTMQDTPQHNKLFFAKKETEVLQDICKSMSLDPIEPGRRKQDIISYLPSCKIFHFAGHGHTDNNDPSQSYLLLEDWESENNRLTVATLMEMNLRERPPFLAYLSACGTGEINDETLLDESLHLISACQLAGFRHVIGTLWEVNDESCVDMAKITYEGMRDGAITDESICRGLHKATRELRNRWLRKANTPLTEDRIGAMTVNEGDQHDARLPRKIILCDLDEEEDRPLHWVPYVHFGV